MQWLPGQNKEKEAFPGISQAQSSFPFTKPGLEKGGSCWVGTGIRYWLCCLAVGASWSSSSSVSYWGMSHMSRMGLCRVVTPGDKHKTVAIKRLMGLVVHGVPQRKKFSSVNAGNREYHFE
jgi:hypothetical protein